MRVSKNVHEIIFSLMTIKKLKSQGPYASSYILSPLHLLTIIRSNSFDNDFLCIQFQANT